MFEMLVVFLARESLLGRIMRTLKTGILTLLCCFILNSEFVLAERCTSLYRDKASKTIGDLVLKQACAVGISGAAAVCAITVTILTAGAAAPITFPITVASAAVAMSKAAYDGYPILGSVERLRNNRKVDKLIVDAYTLSKRRRGGKTLSEFYLQQYGSLDKNTNGQKVPTLRDVALHIIRMDVAQSLCTVGELPYGEGRFFAYLPMESIMKAEKGN